MEILEACWNDIWVLQKVHKTPLVIWMHFSMGALMLSMCYTVELFFKLLVISKAQMTRHKIMKKKTQEQTNGKKPHKLLWVAPLWFSIWMNFTHTKLCSSLTKSTCIIIHCYIISEDYKRNCIMPCISVLSS